MLQLFYVVTAEDIKFELITISKTDGNDISSCCHTGKKLAKVFE